MSDEECIAVDTSDAHMLTAEYKDGELQIVEMTPYERDKGNSILPEITDEASPNKYLQVVNSDNGLVQLDLLNLTLVKCEDGTESYRLIPSSESNSDVADTVTCVMHSDDVDEQDRNVESYVMMEGSDSMMLLQSDVEVESGGDGGEQVVTEAPPKPSPVQILAKAKALQRAKALLSMGAVRRGVRGRRARTAAPTPSDIMASPNFKLYLYYCKLCPYKCNAIKELQAHKAECHASNRGGHSCRGGRGATTATTTTTSSSSSSSGSRHCSKCVYGANSHKQLMKHVRNNHMKVVKGTVPHRVSLNTREVELADVLVCGACGYESADRDAFRCHIETEHGALTV